jgi:hypothetical protein
MLLFTVYSQRYYSSESSPHSFLAIVRLSPSMHPCHWCPTAAYSLGLCCFRDTPSPLTTRITTIHSRDPHCIKGLPGLSPLDLPSFEPLELSDCISPCSSRPLSSFIETDIQYSILALFWMFPDRSAAAGAYISTFSPEFCLIHFLTASQFISHAYMPSGFPESEF